MEKWCSKKEKGREEMEISAIQKQWMQKFDEMMEEATRHMNEALKEEAKRKSKRPRTEQEEATLDEPPKRKSKNPRTKQANTTPDTIPKRKSTGARIPQREALEDCEGGCEGGRGGYEVDQTDGNIEASELEMSRQEPAQSVIDSGIEGSF